MIYGNSIGYIYSQCIVFMNMRKIFILRHIKNKSLQRGSFRMSMSAVSNRLQACGAHSCGGTVVKSI